MTVVRIPEGGMTHEYTEWIKGHGLVFNYHWSWEYAGYDTRNLSGGTDFVPTRFIGINLPEEFAVLFKLKFSLKD